MIISHKYKFIFLKTNKTAGTSIEIALSKVCGPHDVITPLTPKDEKARRLLGYRGAQNYLVPFWAYRFNDWRVLFTEKRRKKRFVNHMPAKRVKQQIDPEIWDNYYKFCFERNPWDRIISLYYWRFKSEPRPTISEFMASEAPQLLKQKGYGVYTIDNEVVVDRVCAFENITGELEAIRAHLGIQETLELPHSKSAFRKDKRHYRDLIGEVEQMRISELFQDEIRLVGYQF